MIRWFFHIHRDGYEERLDLTDKDVIQLNETDFVEVSVTISEEHIECGEPYIVIGDVPLDLELVTATENQRTFKSIEPSHEHQKQIFYNFFGESEVLLCFSGGDNKDIASVKVDIRARKANAQLASTMIDFISSNMEDALLLCFSKSHVGAGAQSLSADKLTKFQLLKDTVEDLVSKQNLFMRDHKYSWKNQLKLSNQGKASGSDSIYYLLTHLDKIKPVSPDKSNIKLLNRSYQLEEVPCEELVSDTDLFENRVIFSFLFSAKQYLKKLKHESENQITDRSGDLIKTDDSDDFVTFDNVLSSYKLAILKHHVNDILVLNKQIEHLIKAYKAKFNLKLIPQLRPKMTPFVASRPHYRIAFKNIHQWYQCNAPDLESNSFLMGLRNLSTIYELTCLLMLHRVIQAALGFDYLKSEYIQYGEELAYQGRRSERPSDRTNNSFHYSKGTTLVSIKYEPRIYQYRDNITKTGDLINVSNQRASRYGAHYYCPDYVVSFSNSEWNKNLVMIFDAKYQNFDNIMKYSLVDTERKYLRDLFEVNDDNSIGQSPVKMLLLFYAHGITKVASRIHKRHHVGEELAIYPQALGIKVLPGEESEGRIAYYINCALNEHKQINQTNSQGTYELIRPVVQS